MAPQTLEEFLTRFRPTVTVLSGEAHGMEYVLDQSRVSLGRGPGVDLALDEPSLAQIHAALEFVGGGFRLLQLAENAIVLLNGLSGGSEVLKADDRFQLGEIAFAYSIETQPGS